MSSGPCQHRLAGALTARRAPGPRKVSRCPRHSREEAGVSVWVWGAGVVPCSGGCPCVAADRFLVVAEEAAAHWRQSADVLVGRSRPTAGCAVRAAESRLAGSPGCALVTVAASGSGTVFRTRSEHVLLRHGPADLRLCGVCAYPWLAAGYRLAHLIELCGLAAGTPSR